MNVCLSVFWRAPLFTIKQLRWTFRSTTAQAFGVGVGREEIANTKTSFFSRLLSVGLRLHVVAGAFRYKQQQQKLNS